MTMDISNQNKLSEFYEELKRINIDIVRPDINKCFADFQFDEKKFLLCIRWNKKCWLRSCLQYRERKN